MGHGSAYEQALVQRGDVTLWLSADATDAWRPAPSGRPGAPKTFSDCAIETALTLRLVFRVPVRQAEGFWRSVLSLMGVDLAAPDHTTLSRRSQSLAVECRRIPSRGPIHRIVDSTGLSIVGEGEWAAVQHGGRGHRGGKTLHRAVDRGGVIVAHALTEPTVDAATMGIDLIETVDDAIARVTADAAYETVAFYAAAEMRDATVVVPPSTTARVSRRRPRSRARDRTITDVRTLGRRRWKTEAGSQLQARVEHAFFRYKSILGDRLRARAVAVGPDAAPVGLHQPLADGQAQARPLDPASPGLAVDARELPEQLRQAVGRHALAVVGDRDLHVDAVPHRGDPDGGRRGRVRGRVGEEVVQHLDEAPPVGPHPRGTIPGCTFDDPATFGIAFRLKLGACAARC